MTELSRIEGARPVRKEPRRDGLGPWLRNDPDRRLGHDPEAPLGTEDELAEIRAGRRRGVGRQECRRRELVSGAAGQNLVDLLQDLVGRTRDRAKACWIGTGLAVVRSSCHSGPGR